MMDKSGFKDFWQKTYHTGNPIAIIITVQVAFFLIIYSLDLLFELKLLPVSYLQPIVNSLSLPDNFTDFLQKPWSLLTSNIIYVSLFSLLFDSLWLYWIGGLFIDFLTKKRFLFVYFGAWLISNVLYVGMGTLFHKTDALYLTGGTHALAAIFAAIAVLVPNYEQPFILVGTIKLKFIAIFYFAFEFLFLTLYNGPAAIAYVGAITFGMAFTYALKAGIDWSAPFHRAAPKATPRMKVVAGSYANNARQHEMPRTNIPTQEEIDTILDKISMSGYDSLTPREKETLFRASNNSNKVDG